MKAKDIKPGVVYAHQRGRGEYADVRAVVFLAPVDSGHLYSTTSIYREKGSPAFLKETHSGAKPRIGRGRTAPDVGYPIATGPADKLAGITLADFEAATDTHHGTGVEFEVLASLTSVTGLYEDVIAEKKKQREEAEQAREAERERERVHSARIDAQQRRLSALGVRSTRTSLAGPTVLAISADDLDKLFALIDDKED